MKYLTIFSIVSLIVLFATDVGAQVTVRGTVSDERTGEPMELVTVVIEGTSIGTTTSPEGTFELELRGTDDILIFSFIGYVTQRITPPMDARN
ncbi:MAG: carboxypeptidase-like regulatory domain-containing protein [Bacteroidota bacterium]|nr:carboxypeptidase-like regulatory domain-containing protein [Bacteroidota bacterium]